jgi:diguanylate cyclase (GGDEF)-like protein/PAS domain S-box-containing protein
MTPHTRKTDTKALRQRIVELEQLLEDCQQREAESTIYYSLFDNLPVALVLFRSDGLAIAMNRQNEIMINTPREQVVGHFNMFDDPEARTQGYLASFERALQGETISMPPTSYNPAKAGLQGFPDGAAIWTETTYFPIYDEQGTIWCVGEINLDVTARVRAEHAKQKSEATVRRAYEDLEVQVKQRTAALARTTHALQKEVLERQQAEEAYRVLVEHSVQGLVIIKDGKPIFANPSAAGITGYSVEELVAMSVKESASLIHPDDRDVVSGRAITRQEGKNEPPRYTFRIVRRDGSMRWVEAFPVRIMYQNQPAVQMTYIDITEQQEARQQIEHSLAILRATLDSTSDGIAVGTKDGELIAFNRAFEELWGMPRGWNSLPTREERIGLVLQKLRDPENYLRYFKESTSVDAETCEVFALKDGRSFECHSTPYRLGNQSIGRVWSYRDVTRRVQAESELHENRARLKAIFDNAAVGIGLMALDGRYIEVNDRCAEMLGYSAAELQQLTLLEISHPDDITRSYKRMQSLVHGEITSYHIEKRFIRKDSSIFWADLSVTLLHNDYIQSNIIIAIFTDITERKRAEEALQEANEQLSQWVNDLEKRNREMKLLSDMSDMLQICMGFSEAYKVIAHFARQLFAGEQSGRLAIENPASNKVEVVAQWGTIQRKHAFDADICPALQNNQPYYVEKPSTELCCSCLDADGPLRSLCIPLSTRSDIVGVFSLLNFPAHPADERNPWEQLASMVTDHIALALTNLRLRQTLREQSIRDPLTGLFNRRYQDEFLERELYRARRAQDTIGIIMLDIDHFKNFNDTYGHDGGDTVLRSIGTFLQSHIRGSDIACRFGGEELLIVLPGASPEDGMKRADELRAAIERMRVEHEGVMLPRITVSLGVACFPHHGATTHEVIEAADTALYKAKAEGRNRARLAATRQGKVE